MEEYFSISDKVKFQSQIEIFETLTCDYKRVRCKYINRDQMYSVFILLCICSDVSFYSFYSVS